MENKIGGIYFPNHLWNGPQVLAWFFLLATLVISLAVVNIKVIKIIAVKFHLKTAFIGGVLLPVFTSLPELVTGFYGGVSDKSEPLPRGGIFSLFNVTGANILQVFMIAGLGLFIFGIFCYYKWQKRSQVAITGINRNFAREFANNWNAIFVGNFWMWLITLIEYIIMIVVFLVTPLGNKLNVGGMSLVNVLFFVIWFGYLIYSYKSNDNEEELYEAKFAQSWLWKINRWLLLPILLVGASLFGFVAYLNSGIVDKFPHVLNIPENAASGLLLSIASSLPEITLFLKMISKRLYVTAASGILGSSVFNLSIPFYSNLISLNPIYGTNFQTLEMNTDAIKIVPTIALSIILYSLLGISMTKKVSHMAWLTIPLVVIIFVGYIVGFLVISQLHH